LQKKIGVAFQIEDDILNLVGEEYIKTKGYGGEDIHEGKMSLIAIHALHNLNSVDKNRLWGILKLKTDDRALIREAIELLKNSNSIEYAKSVAIKLVEEAWNDVKAVIPRTQAKVYLKALGRFFIDRKL